MGLKTEINLLVSDYRLELHTEADIGKRDKATEELDRQILAKIREVLEGVENPYDEYEYKNGFEYARIAILKAMEVTDE